MFYEEKVIGGVLCHRGTPDGKWIPFTIQEMTSKYEALRCAAYVLKNNVMDYLYDRDISDNPLSSLRDSAEEVSRAL